MDTIEKQNEYFDKLSRKKNKDKEVLMDDDYIGLWNSVIDKYSDQAHFIYELLQNADDAGAKFVKFDLRKDGLWVLHNGTERFTVTDPDDKTSRRGHINSITSIGASTKIDEQKIGKFGVGFKAVFAYTETPKIYDDNFNFAIENYIVPIKIESADYEIITGETLFYFPFNSKRNTPEKAYEDILGKLKRLVYPTLFLANLQEVSWKTENERGIYLKEIKKAKQDGDVVCEKIELLQEVGLETTSEKIWLFTRFIEGQDHTYSVGFFLDEKNKLKPKQLDAFCFFPTKENTGLNFIIHAPFLLTDSRERIKRSEKWNYELINLLAELAADSLFILKDLKLIDDDIIRIIPYKQPTEFFLPFYATIKLKLQTEELLPAKGGGHTRKKDAYWAVSPDLTELFSNEQLAKLVGNENAKWVFSSISRTENTEIRDYIDGGDERFRNYREPNIIKSNLDFENKITNLIESNFIQQQDFDWLHRFYEYLSERKSYQDKFKIKPIFKDSKDNAVAAFEQNGKNLHPILFLPTIYADSLYKHIHKELLANEKSKEFIENFGIKKPSLRDEIYHNILPIYENGGEIDTDAHFQKFFKYYNDECPQNEINSFIDLIKDKEFVSYKTKEDETTYRGKASEIYYPSDELRKYFEAKPDTKFVDLKDYYNFIEEKDRPILRKFLLKLGVVKVPRLLPIKIDYGKLSEQQKKQISSIKGDSHDYIDKKIDGCGEIIQNRNYEKSLILWEQLLSIISNCGDSFSNELKGFHKWNKGKKYYNWMEEKFDSSAYLLLTQSQWLVTKNGEFVAPHEITIGELADDYDISNKQLIDLLHFKSNISLEEEKKNISDEDFLEFKEWKRQREDQKQSYSRNPDIIRSKIRNFDEGIEWLDSLKKEHTKNPQNTEIEQDKNIEHNEFVEISFDEDKEFAKGIDELEKKLKIKKSRVDLVNAINESNKYSYQWFRSYLKLLITYGEKQSTTRQESISFQEIKRYKTNNQLSDNFFVLCGASRYIPSEIEDADNFKLTLALKNHTKGNVKIEGVSKKGQDLLIYCPDKQEAHKIISHFSDVVRIEINFTPIIDLLERLHRAFTNRGYLAEWQDIQETMPSLKYIYGPPGTGKTTKICNNIDEILAENPNAKFLILTPTNKAADVLCRKLDNLNTSISFARLGHPTDPELEERDTNNYRDTLCENDLDTINVIASTIHRLPYFEINQFGRLFQAHWDYVIFDESSMTGLHYIVFAILALYKINPDTKFIVAGDPKQIPPVLEVNDTELENFDFQDENIYKMMGLDSFDPKEQRIRDDVDKIENLNTQFRSVKQIGQLFSELSYSKLLKHDREINRKESKKLPDEFKKLVSSNVTFIDIPLDENKSIYKINKLLYSSYQTYCAILVAEIIKYFDTVNKNEQWTIGLIAPYKAQAILLHKLVTSYGISENVKIYSDTVHGFQGDECDIVFFICNPNNYYYTNHEKCLLSKEYIYNVAISRARDYLIIFHPFFKIQDNPFIENITQSYRKNFGVSIIKKAADIEKILFDNGGRFIENNSYTTGHDNVNVFGFSDMKYFVKANDSAIDIQLRDLTNKK
ncbi:putative DNA helicase [Bacteroidales bacterium Barb6]|nr:putative DNA helicase [Bacteroidales bacterium Barb6]